MRFARRCRPAVLLACCGFAYYFGARWAGPSVGARALHIDSTYLDLGERWAQRGFQHSLPIENRSGHKLTIKEFFCSCNCVSFRPSSLVIPAGGTAWVDCTLDLTAYCGVMQARRDLAVTVVPIVEEGVPHSTKWKLHGVVKSPGDPEHTALLFQGPDRLVEGSEFAAKSLVVHFRAPAEHVAAHCPESFTTAEVADIPHTNREQFQLSVRPSQSLPRGTFAFEVLVRATLGDEHADIPVRVIGEVVGDVHASPGELILGIVEQGASSSEIVLFRSRTGKRFAVRSMAPRDPNVRVEGLHDATAPGKHVRQPAFRVTVLADRTGSCCSKVDFSVRYESGKREVLSLPIAFYGLAPRSGPQTPVGQTPPILPGRTKRLESRATTAR
jgi:hypothetical protein